MCSPNKKPLSIHIPVDSDSDSNSPWLVFITIPAQFLAKLVFHVSSIFGFLKKYIKATKSSPNTHIASAILSTSLLVLSSSTHLHAVSDIHRYM